MPHKFHLYLILLNWSQTNQDVTQEKENENFEEQQKSDDVYVCGYIAHHISMGHKRVALNRQHNIKNLGP